MICDDMMIYIYIYMCYLFYIYDHDVHLSIFLCHLTQPGAANHRRGLSFLHRSRDPYD